MIKNTRSCNLSEHSEIEFAYGVLYIKKKPKLFEMRDHIKLVFFVWGVSKSRINRFIRTSQHIVVVWNGTLTRHINPECNISAVFFSLYLSLSLSNV
jgi:hypothetical protein